MHFHSDTCISDKKDFYLLQIADSEIEKWFFSKHSLCRNKKQIQHWNIIYLNGYSVALSKYSCLEVMTFSETTFALTSINQTSLLNSFGSKFI